MFAAIDNRLIILSTRLMTWLNDSCGLIAPKVLRESLMAFLASYTAFALLTLVQGNMVARAAIILFGFGVVYSLMSVLRGYAADADKDWNSSLAMKYMAKAVGKQESMRFGRLLGWVSLLVYPLLSWLAKIDEPFTFVFVYYAAMGSGLVHEYLAAAEPTAPGERRQVGELKLAHSYFD